MTFGEILFWLLVIILLIIIYKLNTTVFWVLLIIAIIIFIFRLFNQPTYAGFEQVQPYDGGASFGPNVDELVLTGNISAAPGYSGLIPDRSTNPAILDKIL